MLMLESIIAEIDAEIARLTSAKALLSERGPSAAKRSPRRPAKTQAVPIRHVKVKRRPTMSAEARERIRQAQIKRWAAVKSAAKSARNITSNPRVGAKKKMGKAKA